MIKKYCLEVSKKQLETISLALDLFSRLESGQFDLCFDMIPWKYAKNTDEVNEILSRLQLLLTGMNNGNLGIGNVSEQSQIAFDMHQVIRHHLSWEREPAGGVMVGFNKPLHVSKEPLANVFEVKNKAE